MDVIGTAKPTESIMRFHLDTISTHNSILYDTLIQPHHVTSDNLKSVLFDGASEEDRGYFARKDKRKYWIDEAHLEILPLRIKDTQELQYKEDIILKPINVSTFRINAEHTIPMKELIDQFCPFTHSNPDAWTLMKMVAITGYIGKTFVCVASEPNFGKTSVFSVLHGITDKCPVFKPRSIPGVLNKINIIGNMVFDEAHEVQKEIRVIMEEFTLCIGGGSTTYINGAMKSHLTKNKYDCSLQSITFLYNNVDCYKQPDKSYFEVIWKNNKAMDDRLLKLQLTGRMTQSFSRDFNIKQQAEDNKTYYINFAKELAYLQEYKKSGAYEKRYTDMKPNPMLNIKGRKLQIWNEILWIIDQYSQSQQEYNKWIKLLEDAVNDYKTMIDLYNFNDIMDIQEERI